MRPRLLLAVAILLLTSAAADPPLPTIVLQGDYDPETREANLQWAAWTPPSGGNVTYHVFLNGQLVHTTSGTTYTTIVTTYSVFHVTGHTATEQSLPSDPFPIAPLPCQIVTVTLLPPGADVDDRCLPTPGLEVNPNPPLPPGVRI